VTRVIGPPTHRFPRVRRILIPTALISVVALVGCGGGSDDAESTTSTAAVATTTTVATAATTTTITPVVPTAPFTIPVPTGGVSANGSGCAPPPGDTLPDGIWFGNLQSVDVGASTVSLDLNCFFSGDAANHAAAEDGETEIPVPDDYYIRNKVKKIYVLPTVANVAVFQLPDNGGNPNPTPAGNGPAAVATMLTQFHNFWIGWLQISGGKVVAVQQQFVP
jgi:hypothetical protein